MAGKYTYPGVYIEEVPSGVRTITGVATSITAFIGRAKRGPVNDPKTINNFGDYQRIFGGIWKESPMSYAVNDFFQNGGSQAIIVRLFRPLFANDAERQAAFNQAVNDATAAVNTIVADVTAVAGTGDAAATAAETSAANIISDEAFSEAAKAAARALAKIARAEVEKVTVANVVNAANLAVDQAVADAKVPARTEIEDIVDDVIDAINGVPAGDPSADAVDAADTAVGNVIAEASQAAKDAAARILEIAQQTPTPTGTAADVQAAFVDPATRDGVVSEFLDGAAEAEIRDAIEDVLDAANNAAAGVGATPEGVATAADGAVPQPNGVPDWAISAAQAVADAAGDILVTQAMVLAAINHGPTQNSIITAAANESATLGRARLSVNELNLEAANEGAWGNDLRARIDLDVVNGGDLFNLSIWDGDAEVGETFRNVSIDENHNRYIVDVLERESKLVRVLGNTPPLRPTHSEPLPDGIAPRGEEFDDNYCSIVQGNGLASDGLAPINEDYIGDQNMKEGIYALERKDLFNLLCIPPYSFTDDVETEVLTEAVNYCHDRRAMLIVDPPNYWTDKEMVIGELFDKVTSPLGDYKKNAAFFFPYLKKRDPERDNQLKEFAPCGAVAGVFARTDAQRGVWKAPAGLEASLVGVTALKVPLTDAENGELNPLGVNCLRSMPPAGLLVWGSRTVDGDDRLASEWKYVPVRRLALFLEESLYRGTQWVVFEPNDEPLWGQIRLNVGTFMHSLFRQGAFQGTTSDEAYFVKCDKETTTQDDVNNGIVNILVGFAPLKPAEFVVIKISQMAGRLGEE